MVSEILKRKNQEGFGVLETKDKGSEVFKKIIKLTV